MYWQLPSKEVKKERNIRGHVGTLPPFLFLRINIHTQTKTRQIRFGYSFALLPLASIFFILLIWILYLSEPGPCFVHILSSQGIGFSLLIESHGVGPHTDRHNICTYASRALVIGHFSLLSMCMSFLRRHNTCTYASQALVIGHFSACA